MNLDWGWLLGWIWKIVSWAFFVIFVASLASFVWYLIGALLLKLIQLMITTANNIWSENKFEITWKIYSPIGLLF